MAQPVALARIASHLKDFDGAFLRCTDCLAVHRITRSDRSTSFAIDGSMTLLDDLRHFLSEHADHRFQILRRSSDAEMLSHARWDPMCRVAWEVSDGEQAFVVLFGRTDLERPREYAVVPANMRLLCETVELAGEILRRVIDEALYPFAAPHSKVEAAVEHCRLLVAACPFDHFEPVDEERNNPNVQLACLPDDVARELRRALGQIFTGNEPEEILDSIVTDLQHAIPVVRLSRRYQIDPHD